jgi:hypothetical protein
MNSDIRFVPHQTTFRKYLQFLLLTLGLLIETTLGYCQMPFVGMNGSACVNSDIIFYLQGTNCTGTVDCTSVYNGSSDSYAYARTGLTTGYHTAYVSMHSSVACVTTANINYITQNGNVGIGTISPAAPLEVPEHQFGMAIRTTGSSYPSFGLYHPDANNVNLGKMNMLLHKKKLRS